MKKICVFTGSRAEYGLLKPLMEEIKQDSSLSLQLLVSGMHLSPEFGNTYQLIEKDNFTIHEILTFVRLTSKPAHHENHFGYHFFIGDIFDKPTCSPTN